MNSQTLYVSLIKGWDHSNVVGLFDIKKQEVDYGTLYLCNHESEYHGVISLTLVIHWDVIPTTPGIEPTERDKWLHRLSKQFCDAIRGKFKTILHNGLTTTIEYKLSDDSKPLEDFEWLKLEPIQLEVV